MSEERLEVGNKMTNPNLVAGVPIEQIEEAEKEIERIKEVPPGYAEVRL